jgi:hypothetical protein
VKILALGVDRRGQPLIPPTDEQVFVDSLIQALAQNAESLRALTRGASAGVAFRGEVVRRVVDAGDPRAAGWSFLLHADDPRRGALTEALAPLARWRGMAEPGAPLIFRGEPPESWFDWLNDNYHSLDLEGKKPPAYVLIVGGPQQVPFAFQSLMHTIASVGRVAFDDIQDLETYVSKLLRIEKAPEPTVGRDVVLFAPDGGSSDPTYFSREYMAKPLGEHIRDDLGFHTVERFAKAATKTNLVSALSGQRPALVYTASHGLGASGEPLDVQKRLNGAICCQHRGPLTEEALVSADDVPTDGVFAEGSVFFQFACYGYGTPAESDFSHWFRDSPERLATEDFIAALPKRLLAHPRGPIAYVGHLDTAFLHGFAEVASPHALERWHTRIAPFKSAVDRLLGVQPSGLAMEDMSRRYAVCNAVLTNAYDRQRRGRLQWTETLRERFLDSWITRSDAQNYMVLGDPAARLRIPDA